MPGRADVVLAFVGVAAIATALELPLRGAGVHAIAVGLGGAVAWASVHGLIWLGLLRLLAGLRARGRVAMLTLIALAIAAWLSLELAAFARLGTRNAGLAWLAIAGSLGAGGLAGAIAWWWAPQADGAPRFVDATPERRRLVLAAQLLGAVAASVADRLLFAGLHPAAHTVLRATALALVAFAAAAGWRGRIAAPVDARLVALALLIGATPFATLSSGTAELQAVWATPWADEGIAMLRRATDFDGDGHSGWLGGGDCAPFDPEVHPSAVEIPGNGVDDNCSDGDAIADVFDLAAVAVPTAASPKSVLLVTIETLRADHTSLYGYTRETTPALERWARDARVYERAFTAGAWTSIAIPTLLRGVNARRLPWQPYAETNRGRLFARDEPIALDPGEQGVQTFLLPDGGAPPLSWWLRRRGMVTAAVVDDRFSELLDPSLGTDLGFDRFVDADAIRGRDPDDLVVDLAIETLASLPADRPFFLWVHLFGPHSPNTEHADVPRFGDDLVAGYDHEIRFVDAQLDRLLRAATERTPALVWVVTADHGESLQANDRMHGFDLGRGVIQVPLVIGGTGLPAGREPAVVSTLDLVPTILAQTQTPAPGYLDGLDLAGAPIPGDRRVFVDTWHRSFDGAVLFDQAGLTDGTRELVLERTKQALGLLDLQRPETPPQAVAAQIDPTAWTEQLRRYVDAPPLQVVGID
ncbi:MAG: sulfatase-like hydrolase/transferase [Deltaproteobacteria bacterium]|nr:sulfatase-like hydrolase/transferase [Deltaproteobacteria bacterium]MBK8714086.1 sulfatase-like hydrolase/transferase [Deltaproteobacteria bacterium]MBP7285662.1 sulfatase-like hydrolase/transferase [Nannocystaceae bacterium]